MSDCPYLQGEAPHRCLLAEHGEPLRNETVLKELERTALTANEIMIFLAGVRYAERVHGITG